jgi:hypothetical protein
MKQKFIILILFVVSFIYSDITHSQKRADDIWEKIEKIKLEKLVKRLNLDDNTSAVFSDKYKSFSNTIRILNQKRTKCFKLMAENLESGEGLDTLVDQVMNIESEINRERMNFASDLKTILTSKQIATMIIFERRFNTELRKLIKQYNEKNKKQNN